MQLVILASMAFLATIAFFVSEPRLHPFEIIAIWLTVIILNAPSFSFFAVNMHWVSVPENGEVATARIIHTMWVIPLIVVWTLNRLAAVRRLAWKLAVLVAADAFMVGIGWGLDRFDIVHFKPVAWPYYALLKMILLLFSAGAALGIRYLMRRDGIPDAFFRTE